MLLLLLPVGESSSITKWFRLYYKTPAIRMFIQPDFVLGRPGSPYPSVLMRGAKCMQAGGAAAQTDTPEPPSPSLHLPLLVLGQTFRCA